MNDTIYVYTTLTGIKGFTAGKLYELTPSREDCESGIILDDSGEDCLILTESSKLTCAFLRNEDNWKIYKEQTFLWRMSE